MFDKMDGFEELDLWSESEYGHDGTDYKTHVNDVGCFFECKDIRTWKNGPASALVGCDTKKARHYFK